jgi:hypothetical protein
MHIWIEFQRHLGWAMFEMTGQAVRFKSSSFFEFHARMGF